jgi:hypothetical protein
MAIYYDEENKEMVFEVDEDDENTQAYFDLLLQIARKNGGTDDKIAK